MYILIDTSFLIYKSYFAYLKSTALTDKNGFPTGAFFGFAKTVIALLKEYPSSTLIFAGDLPTPTWRHVHYSDYKAGRPPIQDDMKIQIPVIIDWIKAFNQNFFALEGWEADDVIHTFCQQTILPEYSKETESKQKIAIFSNDRDLYQLLTYPQISFLQSQAKGQSVGSFTSFFKTDFIKKYELDPFQWLDYKALTGDNSDNLRGVDGIGPKTATKVLQSCSSLYYFFLQTTGNKLEAFSGTANPSSFDHTKCRQFLENPKNHKVVQKIISNLDTIQNTYFLSKLSSVPQKLDINLNIDWVQTKQIFQKYSFNSLIKEVDKMTFDQVECQPLF